MKKLTKEERETIITISEADDSYNVFTYDLPLKRRLQRFAGRYPDAAHLISENGFGGITYLVKRGNLILRLRPPYNEKQQREAAERMRKLNESAVGEKRDVAF